MIKKPENFICTAFFHRKGEYAIVWIIIPYEKVNHCLTFALLNENILVLRL